MILPIRIRLTLWYVAVLAAVLIAFSIGVSWLQHRFSRSQFDTELASVATTLSSVMRSELAESHRLSRAASETRTAVDIPNRTVAILDHDSQALAAHWRGFHRINLPRLGGRTVLTETLVQDGERWRVRLQREESPGGPFMIFVAASEAPLIRESHLLAKALLVGMPIALVLSSVVCWWAASRALRPLTVMSEEAEHITAQSLNRRLSTSSSRDEVGQLERAFNRLLGRVAQAVQTQRHFMADASHELRTPVTAARVAADVTLSREHRDEEEYRDALGIVATCTRRLGRMVDDMLVLARADVGGYRVQLAHSRVDDILNECVDTMRLLASAKGVILRADLQRGVELRVDDALIRQLAINLLENAIRHTTAGGDVRLSLRVVQTQVEISVADTGPGVPQADRDRIFQRFVRLDAARNDAGGAGLGLPIARWVAEVHHGTLTLAESGSSGSTFVARLPLTANADDRPRNTEAISEPYELRVSRSNPIVASETM